MERVTIYRLLSIGITIFLMLQHMDLFAQGPGPGGPAPPATPIDGGVGMLALIGVGYGVRKLYKMDKEKGQK